MAAFKSLLAVLATSVVISEAVFLPSLGLVPIIVGGKILLLPKAIALKAGMGMLGLKIAGSKYLQEKVIVPASLAGAVAGYRASAGLMDAPRKIAEAKTAAVGKLTHSFPKVPSFSLPSAPTDFEATFKVPALPVPSIQWETKSVDVPKLGFTESQSKTITISKNTVPAYAPTEPPKEEIVARPY